MANLTLLHLSDTHFGPSGQEAAQERIAERGIQRALAEHIANGYRKPDLCIFSGDLAHSGKLDQFQKGEAWLKKIADDSGSYLFIVPGNHDVSRPAGEGGFKTIAEKARQDEAEFDKHRGDIEKGPFLKVFRKWHRDFYSKARGQVLSDWRQSALGSVSRSHVNDVPVTLVGLNSAVLSFEDHELRKLVCDIRPLETVLGKVNSDEELIVVVTHHPAGKTVPEDQYLTAWNDQMLQKLLLQSTGPHLYLHGHLHEQKGVSLSLSTGQSLGIYGAGASYQHLRYPIRFAIYDIDFVSSRIQPWVFKWNDIAGKWQKDEDLSHPTRTVLPDPPAGPTGRSPVSLIARHVALDQEMFNELADHFGYQNLLRAVGDNRSALKERQFNAKPRMELEGLRDIPGATESVRRAIDRALGGDLKGAIADMKKIAGKDTRQQHFLLRMLVASPEPRHWTEAEPLLREVGRPFDLLALSFGYWTEGKLDKAIEITKRAITLGADSSAPEDKKWDLRLKNNLAYFYATTENPSHEDEAKKLADECFTRVVNGEEPEVYYRVLDTLGFVEISFARTASEIDRGVQKCRDAYKLGNDLELLLKHTSKAKDRSTPLQDAAASALGG